MRIAARWRTAAALLLVLYLVISALLANLAHASSPSLPAQPAAACSSRAPLAPSSDDYPRWASAGANYCTGCGGSAPAKLTDTVAYPVRLPLTSSPAPELALAAKPCPEASGQVLVPSSKVRCRYHARASANSGGGAARERLQGSRQAHRNDGGYRGGTQLAEDGSSDCSGGSWGHQGTLASLGRDHGGRCGGYASQRPARDRAR